MEQILQDTESALRLSEERVVTLTKQLFDSREETAEIKGSLANTMTKVEGEKLRQANEILRKELAEARAAMHTYKNLVNVSADQVRAQKLSNERRKDEAATLQEAILELQAENHEALTLGNLYHQVMISRWAEGSANRKYDNLIDENRSLRNETFKMEGEIMSRDKALDDVQQVLTERIKNYEETIRHLNLRMEGSVSLEKAEEFLMQIRDLGNAKSDIETSNRDLRSKLLQVEHEIEEAKIMKASADSVYQTILTSSPDDVSAKLVEMTQRINELRLEELKARRESKLSKEREDYFERMHVHNLESIKTLEQEVARWEMLINNKEEAWRQKDSERQKMLLNPSFRGALRQTEENFRENEEIETLKRKLRAAEQALQFKQDQIDALNELPLQFSNQYDTNYDTDNLVSKIKHLQQMLDSRTNQITVLENSNNELQSLLAKTREQAGIELNKISLQARTVNSKTDIDGMRDLKIENLNEELKQAHLNKQQLEFQFNELRKELDDVQFELRNQRINNTEDEFRQKYEDTNRKLLAKENELSRLKNCLNELKEDLNRQAEENLRMRRRDENPLAPREYSQANPLAPGQTNPLAPGQTNPLAPSQALGPANPLAPSQALGPANPLAPSQAPGPANPLASSQAPGPANPLASSQAPGPANPLAPSQTGPLAPFQADPLAPPQAGSLPPTQTSPLAPSQTSPLAPPSSGPQAANYQQSSRVSQLEGENERLKLELSEARKSERIKEELLERSMNESHRQKREIEESKKMRREVPGPSQTPTGEARNLRETISKLEQENRRLIEELAKPKRKGPYLLPEEERLCNRIKHVLQSRSTTLQAMFENKKKVLSTEFYRTLDKKNFGFTMEELSSFTNMAATHAEVKIKSVTGDVSKGVSIKKVASILSKVREEVPEYRVNDPPQRLERKVQLLHNQIHEQRREIELKDKQLAYYKSLVPAKPY